MGLLDVAEVAKELGSTERRVRQMLADGVLNGSKVSGVWLVSRIDLDQHISRVRRPGRPWSSSSAWAVIKVLDGDGQSLTPLERHRANQRVASSTIDEVAQRLYVRAERRSHYVHPGVMERLSGDRLLVLGGVSAAGFHSADVVGEGMVEGYVKVSNRDALAERYGLVGNDEIPNMVLRAVDDEVWPFHKNQRFAGQMVVAVDLFESKDERSVRAGKQLLKNVR